MTELTISLKYSFWPAKEVHIRPEWNTLVVLARFKTDRKVPVDMLRKVLRHEEGFKRYILEAVHEDLAANWQDILDGWNVIKQKIATHSYSQGRIRTMNHPRFVFNSFGKGRALQIGIIIDTQPPLIPWSVNEMEQFQW